MRTRARGCPVGKQRLDQRVVHLSYLLNVLSHFSSGSNIKYLGVFRFSLAPIETQRPISFAYNLTVTFATAFFFFSSFRLPSL